MPSYIEIDQNLNFPSSSGAGKVIFGVNTSGQATITNNAGVTTVIGSGGNTPPTPTTNDFINVESYNRWIYGLDAWSAGSKWDTIASEVDQSDYLRFVLIGGQVNGQSIHRTYVSVSVDYTNLTYRDDGFGSFPVNYVDFINDIFVSHSIYTRITGSTVNTQNQSIGLTGSYCAVDNFDFIFFETGQLDGVEMQRIFYTISTQNGTGLCDSFGGSNNADTVQQYHINLTAAITNMNASLKTWYQPQMPGV